MRLSPDWRLMAATATAGAVHALSFAPGPLPSWSLPFVQLIALAFLGYRVFRASSARQAAWHGFVFGLTNFALGLYWIHTSLHLYGGLASPLAALAVLALACVESLFIVLACGAARWLAGRPSQLTYRFQLLAACIWASSWTAAEWLRGTLFTGFPWLNIGYAHVEGVLAPWAPLIGVYGVAWLAAFAAGALALLACARTTVTPDAKQAIVVAMTLGIGIVGMALGTISWSTPSSEPILVRLTQGNIPQSQKFDPQLMQQGLETYLELAALPPKEENGSPDLIVLPETIMPLFQDRYAPAVWQRWLNVARHRNATLIMGVPLHNAGNEGDRYTNSVIAFDATTPLRQLMTASTALRYDKHHLVPFGEFIPPGFRWFVDALNIPLGDFDRGATRQPLFELNGLVIAPNICYEDVFGEEIIKSVQDSEQFGPGATVLVNVSNLAWFGDSWALRQHLQISRMRAIESARPMLRSTNTGMTAAIDPNGAVRAVLPASARGVLDVEVQGMTGTTPYVRWGNMPILALSAVVLIAGLMRRRTGTTSQ